MKFPCPECDYAVTSEKKRRSRISLFLMFTLKTKISYNFTATRAVKLKRHLKFNTKERYILVLNASVLKLQRAVWELALKLNTKKQEILLFNVSLLQLEQLTWRDMLKLNTQNQWDFPVLNVSMHEGARYPCFQCELVAARGDKLKRHVKRLHELLKIWVGWS